MNMANTTRKTTDSKASGEKAPESKASESEASEARTSRGTSSQGGASDNDGGGNALPGPMAVLRGAREQLAELTGMTPESVSSFERTEDGWLLEVEVLELSRVPDTMSLLASYEVQLDPRGELTGYRRLRRYERGRSEPRGTGGH
ncbi:gas vesicle protein [Streptomyces sp. NPDC058284]|uniref:gas vesicle protein GvpO n=1 Tax=unclassified Streptomyces TaxID=2593676 RepID=UPI003660A489